MLILNKRGQKVVSSEVSVGGMVTGSNRSPYVGLVGNVVCIKVSEENVNFVVMFKFPDGSYKTREVGNEMIECA